MKYLIILSLEVEAAPGDLRSAAQQGFQELADMVNEGQKITLHLLPQDGSAEVVMAQKALDSAFQASTTASLV